MFQKGPPGVEMPVTHRAYHDQATAMWPKLLLLFGRLHVAACVSEACENTLLQMYIPLKDWPVKVNNDTQCLPHRRMLAPRPDSLKPLPLLLSEGHVVVALVSSASVLQASEATDHQKYLLF